jgi:hypothetical protein
MSTRLTPPPERDFPAGRLEQRKEQLVSQIRVEQAPPQWPVYRRRWRLAFAATAAVAVVVIVASVVLPSGETGGASPAAAAVLHRAARAAAHQQATAPPSPGQFLYTKSEGLVENTTVPAGGKAFNVFQTVTRESWIAPDGSGRIHQVEGQPRLATPADHAAWIADGRPDLNDGSGNEDTALDPGGLSYVDLSKLPADPAELKQLIENRSIEGGPSGDAETFTIIGDLLRETYAPPAVRSALYTIASELPGVELIGATHDHLGRPGTGVAFVAHGLSHELIFDPRTSALLAEQTVEEQTGSVLDWTCYLSSGVVDSTHSTP